jgi:hypothetical protein
MARSTMTKGPLVRAGPSRLPSDPGAGRNVRPGPNAYLNSDLSRPQVASSIGFAGTAPTLTWKAS